MITLATAETFPTGDLRNYRESVDKALEYEDNIRFGSAILKNACWVMAGMITVAAYTEPSLNGLAFGSATFLAGMTLRQVELETADIVDASKMELVAIDVSLDRRVVK